MKTIVFQGDSITDAGRLRNIEDKMEMGYGYATMVTGELGVKYPGEYRCINVGVSGNRVVDMYARIKKDTLNLKPDYLSILIGVNDVWHEYMDVPNGVSAEKFDKIYRLFIDEIREELPDCKIIILGAFVTHGAHVDGNWDEFYGETVKRAKVAEQIAKDYGFPFVDLQKEFDEACKKADASFWTKEGVHPLPAGHRLITTKWLEAFEKIK